VLTALTPIATAGINNAQVIEDHGEFPRELIPFFIIKEYN